MISGEWANQKNGTTLPAIHRQQIEELMAQLLAHGWGTLEIEFADHRIKGFRVVESIQARKPVTKVTVE